MATVAEALAIGVEQHKSGNLQAAELLYRQILAVEPNHAEAWHLLGMIASQTGRYDVALEYITRAIQLHGTESAYHNNLGEAYRRLGRTTEAIPCFKAALQLEPNSTAAHNNLGITLKELGHLDEAIACYQRATQLDPDRAEYYNNLGNALHEKGNDPQAIVALQIALRLKPDFAEAHTNLGNALQSKGKLAEAIACYERALHLAQDAVALNNLGNAFRERGQLSAAITCYEQALQMEPRLAEAHNNLGNAYTDRGLFSEAIACFQTAVQCKPTLIEAQNNLGNAFQQSEMIVEAITCYRKSLTLDPDNLTAHYQLAHSQQHICLWDGLLKIAQRLVRANDSASTHRRLGAFSPFSFLALPIVTTAQQQLSCANQWVNRKLAWASAAGSMCAPHSPQRGLKANVSGSRPSKITLGYLSADLHEHATAYLIAEMFEEHDRDRFTVIGYSYGPDDKSLMRQRVIDGLDLFRDIGESNYLDAAKLIASDNVDILIDLKGYTQRARPSILALRPAPIQVSYLGYPGTMGGTFMDYILVDHTVAPADQQPFYAEKLVQLPGCYQVNDSHREIGSATPSPAECGLPDQGFVFCCFNNTYKITPDMFDVWMRLLHAVPGSVLWLLEGNRYAPHNLRREARKRNVAAERLVFAPRQKLPAHLARHRLADLFLDTFPYNAHTTASDALWVGCPILTLMGETFASRVAASLLRTIGSPELITNSMEDYQNLALRLAREPALLAEMRARLETKRLTCGLFDGKRFACNAEKAFLRMWEIHNSGQEPYGFSVSAE